MDVLLLSSSSSSSSCPPTSIHNHLKSGIFLFRIPTIPSAASPQRLVKRHHLEPVFAQLQELAVSSLFNNMEINLGKENHDIPRREGAVSYFTLALELGHFFWHDSEFIAVMLPTHWEIETNREEVDAHIVQAFPPKVRLFFTFTFNIY